MSDCIEACQKADGEVMTGRACCEEVDSRAQAMIFDLQHLHLFDRTSNRD